MVVLSLHIDHVLGALPKNTGKAEDFVKIFCVSTGFPGPCIKYEQVIYPLRCKINMLNPQNVGLAQMNKSCTQSVKRLV